MHLGALPPQGNPAETNAGLFARSRAIFQRMQFLARFETHSFAGRNANFSAGSGIAADAGLAGTDAEDAKTAQFNAFTSGEGLFEAFEDRIHRRLGFGAGKAGALDYMMDDVLLNQWSNLPGATELTVLRFPALMLQDSEDLWNSGGGGGLVLSL